jgi:hypothetical protein
MVKLFSALMAGIFIGAFIAVLTAPIVPPKNDCSVYRVDSRAVTSYVLKPPPAEVIYKACPQVTEKVESVSEPEVAKADDSKPRRHRRHRVRRYWR